MKKKEIRVIVCMVLIAAIAIVGYQLFMRNQNAKNQNKETVEVLHRGLVVQTFDPNVDAVYTIQGDYGTLEVEVKDGEWHVTNEQCPNHICSQTGWVSMDSYLPIVCIPNDVIVRSIQIGE